MESGFPPIAFGDGRKDVKRLIASSLAEKSPLTAKQVFLKIRGGNAFSHHAVYKAIAQLLSGGLLKKPAGALS